MSITAPATVANLVDLTTVQLSERMGKLAERYDALKASVAEFDSVKADFSATVTEMQRRVGVAHVIVKPKGEKRAPRQKKEGDSKFPSLKEIVQTVLGKRPDGLELKGIVSEVQGMVNRKEYASSAKSLSAVVSQAVNSLKQEQLINHDRDSKKYTIASAA